MNKMNFKSTLEQLNVTSEDWNSPIFADILKMEAKEFDNLSKKYIDSHPLRKKAWLFRNKTLGERMFEERKAMTPYERKVEECRELNMQEDNVPKFCSNCKHRGYYYVVNGNMDDKEVFIQMRRCSCNPKVEN